MEHIEYSSDKIVSQSGDYVIRCLDELSNKEADKDLIIGLSGGNSPRALYSYLDEHMPKNLISRLHFVQIDERIVSSDSKDSNQRLVNETLDSLLSQGAIFHQMPSDSSAQESCAIYERTISILFDSACPAIALLGVGEDGHTASIFPDHKHEIPNDDRYVFMTPREKNGYYRMSLSAHAIYSMQYAIFYIPGQNKKSIVSAICDEKNKEIYPASEILHTHICSKIISEM